MNIWMVNHYADPPEGLATRSFDLSRELVGKGHRVRLLVANFSHYHLRPVRRLSGIRLWHEESIGGVRMVWLRTPGYMGNDLRRVANMVCFFLVAILYGVWRSPRPDVVIGVTVHPLAALAGELIARVRRAVFVIEVTDLWPETLIEFGMLQRRSIPARLMRILERQLYTSAVVIVMLWRDTHEYVESLGVDSSKILWLPHGVDLGRYARMTAYEGGSPGLLRVMYLGGFVESNSVGTIIDAAAELHRRGRHDIQFSLVGAGVLKPLLVERARRLDNVAFPPAVPKEQVPATMAAADTFIYGLRDLALYRFGISLNKLTDYLAGGRPIVFFGNSSYDPVAETGAGFSLPPGDPVAIADALERLCALSPPERVLMGRRGRAFLEKYHAIPVLALRLDEALSIATHRHS